MKKLLLPLLTMFSFALFTSCGNEDDPITEWGDVNVSFTATHKAEGIGLTGIVYVYENLPVSGAGKLTYGEASHSYYRDGITYSSIETVTIDRGTGFVKLPKPPRVKSYFFRFESSQIGTEITRNLIVDEKENVEIKFVW